MDNQMTDWLHSIETAVSNRAPGRRIIYFKSENRYIIRDVIMQSISLWDCVRQKKKADKTYDDLMSDGLVCNYPDIFVFANLFGSFQFKNGNIPAFVVLPDFQAVQPGNRAMLVSSFLNCRELRSSLLLISSPELTLPDGFTNEIELISDKYITKNDIYLKLRRKTAEEEALRKKKYFTETELKSIAHEFVGLTGTQVDTILANMQDTLCLRLKKTPGGDYRDLIKRERVKEASKDPAVRFREVPAEDTVAGLGNYSRWLAERKEDLKNPERAAAEGTPAPKGILLCGIPGTGKTAMAQQTAKELDVSLIQFDMSRISSKWLGESQAKLTRYLERIEAFGSCVLLIDEIEKILSVNDSTHESKIEMIGILLDWMQTRKANVFLFITANSIQKLPPELLRDGRLSERFFAFMPSRNDLAAILCVKLTKYLESGLFSREFKSIIQNAPRGQKDDKAFCNDPVGKIFDDIADQAKKLKKQGTYRLPFMTGANLEKLLEETLRVLRKQRRKPYCFEDFAFYMKQYAASPSFVPHGQSNAEDIVAMWLDGQKRQYVDVSGYPLLPFDKYFDGKFNALPEPQNPYDAFFQEVFREKIEETAKKRAELEKRLQNAE